MRWLCALLVLLLAAPASAGPWAAPGDARLRSDVELLDAHGYIVGPVDAWPLPWVQIDRGIERAEAAGPLPPHLAAAVARLKALSDRAAARSGVTIRVDATTDASLVRTFERVARNPGDVSASVSGDAGDLHLTLGATWQSEGTDRQAATRAGNGWSPDPSFAALRLGGNWALYGGWFDIWWGAGHDGAMIFSTSARPFARVGFRRLEPFSIDAPVLRWLGPISFDAFVGFPRERREFDNPAIIGMRLAFQPTPWFEIGLNRGLMLCGRGRPCDWRTIGQALIGIGDFDNTGTLDEPGNQLAGFDMSYRRPIGETGQVLKLHFATTAEDADNIVIEQFARQIGASVSGPVGREGAMIDAGVEYVDTQAATFFGRLTIDILKPVRGPFPGSTYNNFIYRDGWTFGRRPIGHSLDADTRALTFHWALTDTRNRRWRMAARHIHLNVNEVGSDGPFPANRISRTRERIGHFEGGVNWPTRFGDVRAAARLQHDAPDTPGRTPFIVQGEIGWTTRF